MRANQVAAVVLALVALTAMPVAGVAGASVAQNDTDDGETDGTDGGNESDVAPGERLSGVVGAQSAELGGEVQERAFGLRLANASTNESAADVVAEQATEIQQRLDGLDQRLNDLREQREAGEITRGEFAARAAEIEAERASLERVANHTAAAAGELPADLLEERGVNASAIDQLAQRASELGGQEIRDVARGIAGENVGQFAAQERGEHEPGEVPGVGDVTDSDEAGPPSADDRGPDGNETDRGDGQPGDSDQQGADGSDAGQEPRESDADEASGDATDGQSTDDSDQTAGNETTDDDAGAEDGGAP